MSSSAALTPSDISNLSRVVSLGFTNAAEGLSMMVDKTVKVTAPSLKLIPVEKATGFIGEPEQEVYAAYLAITGDLAGHMLLILSLNAAEELVCMLMGARESIQELNDVERSALGEVANVTGSFFLRALAESTDLDVRPSPPSLAMDMAGAVLDGPLISLAMSMEEVLVIDTWFTDEEHQIGGLLLVLPDADSLKLIAERLN